MVPASTQYTLPRLVRLLGYQKIRCLDRIQIKELREIMWLVSILHLYCARLGHCYLQNLHSVKQKTSLYFLTLKDLLENTANWCSSQAVVIKV